jgi:hypothetical protein
VKKWDLLENRLCHCRLTRRHERWDFTGTRRRQKRATSSGNPGISCIGGTNGMLGSEVRDRVGEEAAVANRNLGVSFIWMSPSL